MDSNTTALVITTLIASLISSIVAIVVGKNANKKERECKFNDHLLELNRLAMQYPYLEDDEFCATWNANRRSSDEKYQRYDNYCCIVFNLLEQIWKFHKKDTAKIENIVCAKELILRHKEWWKAPSGLFENLHGYNSGFVSYANKIIDNSRAN